jgi:hypothetical protein
MSLHVSSPVGETWKVTESTPDPASVAVPEKVFVPVIGEPGFVIETIGPKLSTMRADHVLEAAWLPALSLASARKS